MPNKLAQIMAEFEGEKGTLIPVLQKVQENFGYLPEDIISEIAKFSRILKNEVFGVASFCTQFHFKCCIYHTSKAHQDGFTL
ncbi:MAG: NAD(P)H-dependent oxidoreductase subunit E [Chloroflexota bacterium]|nr:MAG: NAD(P)H-dependent oxidoreductase subunit E [Chloroflexota bacterium]